ncbi:hypothetical protein Glove_374g61 [Diversispora epigaea]|uniref:Uncharacterized protein n=1 Tax=Diversispora epigaea TaxID=1348612 RepID=A0A397HD93_9GLOM|nr:hypothetical protein Glove_374g61 [Diversispora epigaea]
MISQDNISNCEISLVAISTQSEHDTPTVPACTEELEIRCSVLSDLLTEILASENLEQCEDTYTLESFDPEEKSNGGLNYRGPKAFSQSKILENEKAGQTFRYSGGIRSLLSKCFFSGPGNDGVDIVEQKILV